jgi:hypothetical protein
MTESARATAANAGRKLSDAAAIRPYAPATWNHAPNSRATSARSSSGSIAPVSVVPAIPTTATGTTSSRRSSIRASRSVATSIRPEASQGTCRRRPGSGPAQPKHPGRALNRVVSLLGGVDPGAHSTGQPVLGYVHAALLERPLPGSTEPTRFAVDPHWTAPPDV